MLPPDDEYEDTIVGTPQGGNISPLLANIMLNELDKELEARGLDRSESVAVVMKLLLKYRCEHLCYRLLYKSVYYCWYSQLPCSTLWFWYLMEQRAEQSIS